MWASAWLESVVAPVRYDHELRTVGTVDTEFSDSAARPAPLHPPTPLNAELAHQTA